jgi:hypothetical protein
VSNVSYASQVSINACYMKPDMTIFQLSLKSGLLSAEGNKCKAELTQHLEHCKTSNRTIAFLYTGWSSDFDHLCSF